MNINFEELEKELLNKPYQLTEQAFNDYCGTVKNNDFVVFDQAVLKLNRNILLSSESVDTTKHGNLIFHYGKLNIVVNPRTRKIVGIKNHAKCKSWKKNYHKCKELNSKFGIMDNLMAGVC